MIDFFRLSEIMSTIPRLNPKGESALEAQALAINIWAPRGLIEMLKTKEGKGAYKDLFSSLLNFQTKPSYILYKTKDYGLPTRFMPELSTAAERLPLPRRGYQKEQAPAPLPRRVCKLDLPLPPPRWFSKKCSEFHFCDCIGLEILVLVHQTHRIS